MGIDCHIGSQITKVHPFIDTLKKLKQLIAELKGEGICIKYLDLGGGLGITYNEENPPLPHIYAQAIIEEIKDLDCHLILEPGRVIVGNGGILVTRVLYTKEGEEKYFIIVDAGMNDLIRPSLYDAFQEINPVTRRTRQEITADVVGPICESGDFLAKNRKLPLFNPGELMAVMSAGAYGFTMSSNYNSRVRIPEVLVKGDKLHLIRKREDYEDLVRGEAIPECLFE